MEFSNKNKISKEEVERYCRQIVLPEIGPEGQEKIARAKVLVIGAGGLGSPCLMYLAGAGVGELGIVDGDSVDTSNLHRQIIHSTKNKGMNKARSAENMIKAFNPMVKVNVYEEHLTSKNAIRISKDYDMLIDCCDNPATRYLTSDVCVVLNKPLVSGSAVKWEGQLTVYVRDSLNDRSEKTIEEKSKDSSMLPCYRCLFPIPTPTSAVCSCSESGVFGPVPGMIGTLQANEAVKLILGASDKLLAKRMLMYDAYEMSFKIFKLRSRKPDCMACGEGRINAENLEKFDYDDFVNPKSCRVEKRVQIPSRNNLKWTEFLTLIKNKTRDEVCLLDVRTQEQYNMFNLDIKNYLPEKLKELITFINIPLKELQANLDELQNDLLRKDKEIFITCRAGNLSTHATKFLLEKGFEIDKVFNLEDGIHGYINEVDPINTPYY